VDIDRESDPTVASSSLMQHVQKYVDDAVLLRTQGHELVFTLPLASADKFAGKAQIPLGPSHHETHDMWCTSRSYPNMPIVN